MSKWRNFLDDRHRMLKDLAENVDLHVAQLRLNKFGNLNVEKYQRDIKESQTTDLIKKQRAVEDELDKIKHHTGTPWSITIRSRVFNSMEASGLLYKIEDRDLMDKVLKLYQESYQRYKFIGDYDNTHIHKMDDILLSRFIYRNEDNPLKWRWLIDWNDKNNFELIKNYRVFKSYLITNRGTKRLLKINTASQIRETQNTLEAIDQYLLKNKQL